MAITSLVGHHPGSLDLCREKNFFFWFYYESRKRELKTRPIYECRCDERLKTKDEKSTPLTYTGFWGTGITKDKDEVNKRDVSECDG